MLRRKLFWSLLWNLLWGMLRSMFWRKLLWSLLRNLIWSILQSMLRIRVGAEVRKCIGAAKRCFGVKYFCSLQKILAQDTKSDNKNYRRYIAMYCQFIFYFLSSRSQRFIEFHNQFTNYQTVYRIQNLRDLNKVSLYICYSLFFSILIHLNHFEDKIEQRYDNIKGRLNEKSSTEQLPLQLEDWP